MKNHTWSDKSRENYALSVVILRAQPLHNGHLELLKKASEISKNILVIIGSANCAPNIRNPFSYAARKHIILESAKRIGILNITCEPVNDVLYNDQRWITQIQKKVYDHVGPTDNIVIVGHKKDHSSFYLEMFPTYNYVEVPNKDVLDSTTIRDMYFGKGMIPRDVMPAASEKFLIDFMSSSDYERLREEYHYISDYKMKFANAPFPPTFVTTDAVVINNGYILLVKRRVAPGKGLWALPGGFLNQHERIIDGTIRELQEETRIKVSTETLRNSIRQTHVFDSPQRSLRGRTITHASLITLYEPKLPKVRGSDDADRAKWVSISVLYNMQNQMFEDHFSIATYFINRAE